MTFKGHLVWVGFFFFSSLYLALGSSNLNVSRRNLSAEQKEAEGCGSDDRIERKSGREKFLPVTLWNFGWEFLGCSGASKYRFHDSSIIFLPPSEDSRTNTFQRQEYFTRIILESLIGGKTHNFVVKSYLLELTIWDQFLAFWSLSIC